MDKLIQTESSSIIYGDFRGEPNQELFRCPRQNDKDVARYINEYRSLVCPMGCDNPFENDDTKDLSKVDGYKLKDYWRMYFRGGWAGRWMAFENVGITQLDCAGVNLIIDWICENFPNGCDWKMKEYFSEHFKKYGERYLIRPFKSEFYKIMVNTTYGNSDYPVRIYVYEKEKC